MNRRATNRRYGLAMARIHAAAGTRAQPQANPFAALPLDASDDGDYRDDMPSLQTGQQDETIKTLSKELQVLQKKLNFLQKIDLSDDTAQGDVSFVVKYGKVIRAHRYILASKSSIFKKMFETNMTEKRSGEIHIEDIEFPVLRAVIEFLYTADIKFTDEATASEVFKAAHKYDIPELQAECEAHLSSSVTEENLSEMLKISHTYGTEHLKARSIQVFKDNFDRVHARVLSDLLSRG